MDRTASRTSSKKLAGRTAYSYIRFSSPKQEHGASLERQTDYSVAFVQKHGLHLDDSLNLRDLGVSAFRGKNAKTGALAAFLTAVQSGRVAKGSMLLVENLDRLSRDELAVSVSLFLQILTSGIDIVTLLDNRVYTKQGLDMQDLIISIAILSRGHEESATKSIRVRDAYERKVAKARAAGGGFRITRMGPGWLRANNEGGWDEIPERVKVVREIFRLYDEGLGKWRIAQALNERGIPTFRAAKRWTPRYIANVLTSPAVIGTFRPGHWEGGKHRYKEGQDIEGYFPQIVERALFERCYNKIKGRYVPPVRPGRIHLLSGLVYDGHKNEKAVVWGTSKKETRANGKSKTYRHFYFIAESAILTKSKYKSWNMRYLERNFLLFCLALDWKKIAEAKLKDQSTDWAAERAKLQKRDKALTQEIANLYTLAAIGKEDLENAAAQIKAREQEQRNNRTKLQQLLSDEERENATARALSRGSPEEKLMRKVIQDEGDKDTRMRLREEIRRRVERITMYPFGFDVAAMVERETGVPLNGGKLPCYRVAFRNGTVRWVVPEGHKQTEIRYILEENAAPDNLIPPLEFKLSKEKRRTRKRAGREVRKQPDHNNEESRGRHGQIKQIKARASKNGEL